MAHTKQRKVRMDEPIWKAALWLARHRGRDASAVIRLLVDGWIREEAARDREVAGNPLVHAYLTGGRDQGDEVDDQLRGQLVLLERFPPLPRAS